MNFGQMKLFKVKHVPVDKVIQRSLDYSARHRGNHMQIETDNKEAIEPFLRRLNDLAEVTRIDALGGRKAESGWRRFKVDLSFEDVIGYCQTGVRCGIKTYHYPMGKFDDWEKWEGGYIEGFVRMDGNEDYSELFIWTYIRMEHLATILEEFKNDLEYHYF